MRMRAHVRSRDNSAFPDHPGIALTIGSIRCEYSHCMTSKIDATLDQALVHAASGNHRLLASLRSWRRTMPDALLQAALGQNDKSALIGDLRLDPDQIAHRQMFPHLHFSCSEELRGHPLEADLRADRLRTGLMNKRVLRERNELMAHFFHRGASVLVFKGADLAFSVYPDACCRKVGDIDLLVSEDSCAIAAEVLRANGWSSDILYRNGAQDDNLVVGNWSNPEFSVTLDVHTTASHHTRKRGASKVHFEQAVAYDNEVGGVVLGLCPEHGLEQVCCHGLSQNYYPPVRWAADAHWILGAAGQDFDWDRLLEVAQNNHSAPVLYVALSYLALTLETNIPGDILSQLRTMPCRRSFRSAWTYRLDLPNGAKERTEEFLSRFQETYPDDSTLRASVRLPGFVSASQGISNPIQALGRLAKKAVLNKRG